MCVKVGDGYQGWPECGPFDAVIVTAALGHVPPPLIEQLKVGGRLIRPLGPADAPQQLTVIEKIAPSETQTRSIILVQFVPLTRSLSAGTIDAAIDVLLPLPEKIRRQRLGTEWLTVVARRRHPKVVGMRSAFAVPHLAECQRALRPGGLMNIVVPYYTSLMMAQDLTHKHAFCEETWRTTFRNPYYKQAGSPAEWKWEVGLNVIIRYR